MFDGSNKQTSVKYSKPSPTKKKGLAVDEYYKSGVETQPNQTISA